MMEDEQGIEIGERLYLAALRGWISDLERIRDLGVSEAAETELSGLIARFQSDVDAS